VSVEEAVMISHRTNQSTQARSRRWGAFAIGLLLALPAAELSADRRGSGGSARQSRNNASANRSSGENRSANQNRNVNQNRNTNANVNRNVNVNQNVNVNRNVNVNNNAYARGGYGYPRGGAVVAGEEGAVAVGRRGAVAVGEEGAVGVGRYGGVVAGGEVYEDGNGWAVAAGVAAGVAGGIAIGTMMAKPPVQSTTIVVGGTNYMYSDGSYYERVYYGGEVSYRVVAAPAGAIITTLPSGCTTTVVGGASYTQCGTTYYQRVSSGYQVVVF
jgi:hypothetical protein